jgi:hypothetical protein
VKLVLVMSLRGVGREMVVAFSDSESEGIVVSVLSYLSSGGCER